MDGGELKDWECKHPRGGYRVMEAKVDVEIEGFSTWFIYTVECPDCGEQFKLKKLIES